jgi:hypothetical protein
VNRAEIIARFEKYGFRDRQGHPLVNCLEFQMLLDQAVADSDQVRSLERELCRRNANARPDEN